MTYLTKYFCSLLRISTHTLTWSVTKICKYGWGIPTISTHTLTWSVTKNHAPRTYSQNISTHTLTWSVTIANITRLLIPVISTHTLTWSVTNRVPSATAGKTFQLTRSRGAWHGNVLHIFGKFSNFNSHAHVERDSVWICKWYKCSISTHTLTWSVTVLENVASIDFTFQLTRSRGAWRITRKLHKE